MSEPLNNPKIDSAERDKVIRLVDYLTQFAELQSKTVRDVEEYQKVFWINDVPRQKGCFTQAWGCDEAHNLDVWVEIQSRDEPGLPAVPDVCKDWVNPASLRNKSDIPELPDEITEQIENPDRSEDFEQLEIIPATKRLENHPEIQRAWDSYVEGKWLSWRDEHNDWEKIKSVYSDFFVIRQEQIRLGEEYELVLALGLLMWQTPSKQRIRRHLLVADAILEFEAELGKFILKPHTEGAKIRPELDMLDIDERPADVVKRVTDDLKDKYDPWEKNIIDGTLRSVVHSLDSQGEYRDCLDARDVEVLDKPIVVHAPALILRKRSAKGRTEALKRIKERIETGEYIPDEFRNLAEIQPTDEENTDNYPSQTRMKFDGEIFFPKPSNDEQRLIVDKIRSTSGVLVQGPPGTGKSHTIANLICHLLATGHRILITAKTPRALEVLEGLVPKELRALCINLIGSGSKETRSLESSVGKILREYDDQNEARSLGERETLEEKLHHLQKGKSKVNRRLRTIRESETFPESISEGVYQGTAAEIAEAVNRDRSIFEWFTDDVPEDKTCHVSENDVRRIIEDLRHFTPEKRQHLKLEFPNSLPSQSRWKNLIENEVNATREENSAVSSADERIADGLSRSNRAYVESLRDALNALLDKQSQLMELGYPWMEQVLRDAITGKTSLWYERLNVTKNVVKCIEPLVKVADDAEIEGNENASRRRLLDSVRKIERHLKLGGTLGWWVFRPRLVGECINVIKDIKINGKKCSRHRDFSVLAKVLDVQVQCEEAWDLWEGLAQKSQTRYDLQMHTLKEMGDALENALSLEELTNECREKIRQNPAIGKPVWSDESQVETIVASCRLALARQRRGECEREIRDIENPVASLAAKSNAHSLTGKLRDAIRERSPDRFAKIANQLQDLRNEQERVRQLDDDVSAMRQHLPRLMDTLEQTYRDPCWDERVNYILGAWHWAHARYWVEEYIRQEDVPALAKHAKQIEDGINNTIAQLAELRAWSFCFKRMTKNHLQHMVAWRQLMQKVGKGTGRHAQRYRYEAQQHLNQCYEAVPAWVMPLHRIWDTVNPEPGMFDIIIVDEASQCGVEAMPLLFLGKKILIVGDNKQISPEAVGWNRDDVQGLIGEYLHDFRYKSSFYADSSLFDYGERHYADQRITLCEHFRCIPEIIRFSNELCYSDTPLIPLRDSGPDRLVPLVRQFVEGGYRKGSQSNVINPPEANAIVDGIADLCGDNTGRYHGKSMGVVVLQGEAQARLIEMKLMERLGLAEMERRRLVCGRSMHFQGDERDIIFLSMVAATSDSSGANVGIHPLTRLDDVRRFNVSASRAKDQMYLFHSVTRDDLRENCLRRRLLEFFENTTPRTIEGVDLDELEYQAREKKRHIIKQPDPFESWFELDVALDIARRGFRVIPQYEVANRRIDLVVEGGNARLAVECDGDEWHGPDEYEDDMIRQRQLERCGWEFFRVRRSVFVLDRKQALERLWRVLEERGISPTSH